MQQRLLWPCRHWRTRLPHAATPRARTALALAQPALAPRLVKRTVQRHALPIHAVHHACYTFSQNKRAIHAGCRRGAPRQFKLPISDMVWGPDTRQTETALHATRLPGSTVAPGIPFGVTNTAMARPSMIRATRPQQTMAAAALLTALFLRPFLLREHNISDGPFFAGGHACCLRFPPH